MSAELYEVVSLAARYLFAVLGIIIVLRSFFWLFSDHSEKKHRIRRLPTSGTIGELVVVSGSEDLREGDSFSVPWEGILGSVRSCDICIPDRAVRRNHLSFLYDPEKGLILRPFRGCNALVNTVAVNSRTSSESAVMRHGSFLQLGRLVLRLRVFSGLDPSAGFDNAPQTAPVPGPYFGGPEGMSPSSAIPPSADAYRYFAPPVPPQDDAFTPERQPDPGPSGPERDSCAPVPSAPAPLQTSADPQDIPASSQLPVNPPQEPAPSGPCRARRKDGWEADWSD